ncbi:hypothetical protein ACFO9E_04100 [Streptomyces maoxianensis]|uniref:Uncharacterized protein n=1 Tax=Streptomyces maoxianensis TaxID=1459942 RepID=A0ABV9FZD3_9ACTN|nr:hypothetical protein [Streptomyces sp. ISL-1]MBT2393545.1 hypothetical protein [Streptomyces sp. ISL-1]
MSGRLTGSTAPMLKQALRLRETDGFTVLFVDVSTLADDWELTPDEIRDVFPCGPRGKTLTFHIIGPADGLRWEPGHDPRFVLHTGAASAWQAWVSGPSTLGVATAAVRWPLTGFHLPALGARGGPTPG